MKKKGPKFLIFYTSEEQFAINIRDIVIIEKVNYDAEMQQDNRIKKVNSYPNYIEGVFAYKNRIIPIIEFEYFLSNKKMKRHAENKIIIVKGSAIDYGILVNDVQSIIELRPDTFVQLYKDFPLHMTEKYGEVYIIPDLEQMLSHQQIKHVFNDIKDE